MPLACLYRHECKMTEPLWQSLVPRPTGIATARARPRPVRTSRSAPTRSWSWSCAGCSPLLILGPIELAAPARSDANQLEDRLQVGAGTPLPPRQLKALGELPMSESLPKKLPLGSVGPAHVEARLPAKGARVRVALERGPVVVADEGARHEELGSQHPLQRVVCGDIEVRVHVHEERGLEGVPREHRGGACLVEEASDLCVGDVTRGGTHICM